MLPMQQQYHKLTIIHTRNTNPILPISVSSDWSRFHQNQNTFVLPSVIRSNARAHITSPRIYSLQPQPQERRVNRSSREIRNASNIERSESFITGGDPHLADLWREINSFDYETFVKSIENHNIVTNASNYVQKIHASFQEFGSVSKDGHVSDEFAEDNLKPRIKDEKCHDDLSSPITYAQTELPPLQNPSHPDTSSSDSTNSSQPLQESNGSNRSTTVLSPSTSQCSSPPPSSITYKCTVPCCKQKFKNYRSLVSHLRILHGHHGKHILDYKKKTRKAKIQCTKCQHFFVSKWYLKKHLCHKNIKQDELLNCEYCQNSYVTDCERKKHYAKDHSDKIKELWEQQWYSNNINN